MFNFEKLEVWQEAIHFADLIYAVTRIFPDEERFGLTNQMRWAAVSISSNIAEGSSRSSRPGFGTIHMTSNLGRARHSVRAVFGQPTRSAGRGLPALPVFLIVFPLNHTRGFNRLYSACEKQSKMLSGLRRSLLEAAA